MRNPFSTMPILTQLYHDYVGANGQIIQKQNAMDLAPANGDWNMYAPCNGKITYVDPKGGSYCIFTGNEGQKFYFVHTEGWTKNQMFNEGDIFCRLAPVVNGMIGGIPVTGVHLHLFVIEANGNVPLIDAYFEERSVQLFQGENYNPPAPATPPVDPTIALKQQIADLGNTITTLSQTVANKDVEIKGITEQMGKLQVANLDLTTNISGLEKRVLDLTAQNNQLSQDKEKLMKEYNSKSELALDLQKKLDVANEIIKDNNTDIAELNATIRELKEQLSSGEDTGNLIQKLIDRFIAFWNNLFKR